MSLDGYVAGPGQSLENPLGEAAGWREARPGSTTISPRCVGLVSSPAAAHYSYSAKENDIHHR